MKVKGKGYKWQPLVATGEVLPHNPKIVAKAMEILNCSEADAIKALDDDERGEEIFVNELYQVTRKTEFVSDEGHKLVHINVRRRDGAPVHDWRHLQQIKNELLGPECEAYELYPAESRKVDSCNKYHLWGVADPSYRLGIGWTRRDVQYEENKDVPGLRQRPQTMEFPNDEPTE